MTRESLRWVTRSVAGLAGLALLVATCWEGLRLSGVVDRSLLPSSWSIASELITVGTTGRFWEDLIATLFRALAGLSLAVTVGVPVGFLVGASPAMRFLGLPTIDFFRSIPVTTLYPVVVLTLGIGNLGKVGMVFLACVFVLALHAATAVDQLSQVRHHTAALFGANGLWITTNIILLEALPNLLTGTRVGVGLALIVSTLTEMFMGAGEGMGQTLMEAYSVYDLGKMYAYITALGILGFILNQLLQGAEARAHSWKAD